MAIPTTDGIIGQTEGAMSKERIEQTDLRRPWPAVHPRRFRIHRAHQFCGGPRRRRCSEVFESGEPVWVDVDVARLVLIGLH
jgi:hypothetical protein